MNRRLLIAISKRVAARKIAKDECSGIKDIHKYVKCRAEKLQESGQEEGAAFGTAWSIACKHKRDVLDPKNEVCTKPPSGYLKKKTAGSDVSFSIGRKSLKLRYLNIYADRSGQRAFITVRLFFPSKFGFESSEEFAVEVHKGRSGRMEFLDSYELSLVEFHKNAWELGKVFTLSEWVKSANKIINSINYLIKRNHKKVWHGFHGKDRLRVLPSSYGSIKNNFSPEVETVSDEVETVSDDVGGQFSVLNINLELTFGNDWDVAWELLNATVNFEDYYGYKHDISFSWKGFTASDKWDLEEAEFISLEQVKKDIKWRGAFDRGGDALYDVIIKSIGDEPVLFNDDVDALIDAIAKEIHKKKNGAEWRKEIKLFWDYVDETGWDM